MLVTWTRILCICNCTFVCYTTRTNMHLRAHALTRTCTHVCVFVCMLVHVRVIVYMRVCEKVIVCVCCVLCVVCCVLCVVCCVLCVVCCHSTQLTVCISFAGEFASMSCTWSTGAIIHNRKEIVGTGFRRSRFESGRSYGVATMRRLPKIMGLFCKRAQ